MAGETGAGTQKQDVPAPSGSTSLHPEAGWSGASSLSIPPIRDRVAQTAAKLVLEPIIEADLPPEQHGYRSGRDALTAVKQVHSLLNTGHTQVVDADLSAYFDTVPHSELLTSAARRVVDRHMLHLIKMWLETPVEEIDERASKATGVPIETHSNSRLRGGIEQADIFEAEGVNPARVSIAPTLGLICWVTLGAATSDIASTLAAIVNLCQIVDSYK